MPFDVETSFVEPKDIVAEIDEHLSRDHRASLCGKRVGYTQVAASIQRIQQSIEDYLAALGLDKQNLTDRLSRELQDPRRRTVPPIPSFEQGSCLLV